MLQYKLANDMAVLETLLYIHPKVILNLSYALKK